MPVNTKGCNIRLNPKKQLVNTTNISLAMDQIQSKSRISTLLQLFLLSHPNCVWLAERYFEGSVEVVDKGRRIQILLDFQGLEGRGGTGYEGRTRQCRGRRRS